MQGSKKDYPQSQYHYGMTNAKVHKGMNTILTSNHKTNLSSQRRYNDLHYEATVFYKNACISHQAPANIPTKSQKSK